MSNYNQILESVLSNTEILEKRNAYALQHGLNPVSPEQIATQICNNLDYFELDKVKTNFDYICFRYTHELVCLNKDTGIIYSIDREEFDFFDECDDFCFINGLEYDWESENLEVVQNQIRYLGAYNTIHDEELYHHSAIEDEDYYMPYTITEDEVLNAVSSAHVSEMVWTSSTADGNDQRNVKVAFWLTFQHPNRHMEVAFEIVASYDADSDQIIYSNDPKLKESWKLRTECFNNYPDLPLGRFSLSYRYAKDYNRVFGVFDQSEFMEKLTDKLFDSIDLESESYFKKVVLPLKEPLEACDLPF